MKTLEKYVEGGYVIEIKHNRGNLEFWLNGKFKEVLNTSQTEISSTEGISQELVDKINANYQKNTYPLFDKNKLLGIQDGAEVNDPNTTLKGNFFNGHQELVMTDSDGKLPALDGSMLVNLPIISSESQSDFTGFVSNNGIQGMSLHPKGEWLTAKACTEIINDSEDGYNAVDNIYTAKVAGYYDVNVVQTIDLMEPGAKLVVALFKNGSMYQLIGRNIFGGSVDDYNGVSGSSVVYLNGTTDYINVAVYHSCSTDKFLGKSQGYCSFSAFKIK